MPPHLQNFPKEAHVLIQEPEAGAEAMHTAQHQGVVTVVLGLLSQRPTPLEQVQSCLPVHQT